VFPVTDQPVVQRSGTAFGLGERQGAELEVEPPVGFPGGRAPVAIDADARAAVLLKGDGVLARVLGLQDRAGAVFVANELPGRAGQRFAFVGRVGGPRRDAGCEKNRCDYKALLH
jgi:hypothetical protein